MVDSRAGFSLDGVFGSEVVAEAGVAMDDVVIVDPWVLTPGGLVRVALVRPHIGGSVDSSTAIVVSIPIHVMRQQ